MTALNPNEIYDKLTTAGNDWADKNAAANLLDETKKSILARIAFNSNEKTEAAKERYALASTEYSEHLEIMVKAKQEATRARVAYDSIKTWVELKRTLEATKRAEMKLT